MELTLFLASSAILLLVLLRKSRPKAFSLPPGPRPIPILGNALDFTIRELWMTTHKWAAQYGMYFNIFPALSCIPLEKQAMSVISMCLVGISFS